MALFPREQLAKGVGGGVAEQRSGLLLFLFASASISEREENEWRMVGEWHQEWTPFLLGAFKESDWQNAYIPALEGSSRWQKPNIIPGVPRLLFLVVTLILYLHVLVWLSLLNLACKNKTSMCRICHGGTFVDLFFLPASYKRWTFAPPQPTRLPLNIARKSDSASKASSFYYWITLHQTQSSRPLPPKRKSLPSHAGSLISFCL